jgi:alpha-tubulin suppressor-like RCC1 family protein
MWKLSYYSSYFRKKVVCWGRNNFGQCNVPEDLENVISIKCGHYHTTALISEGKVFCYGYNNYGECDVPKDLENVISIECDQYHTIALTSEGKVVCWGDNGYEQCNVPEGLIASTDIYSNILW